MSLETQLETLSTQVEILNNQVRQALLIIEPRGATQVDHTETVKTTAHDTTATPGVEGVQGAQASQPAQAAGSVEVDLNGMPWDSRIHSGATDETGNHKKTAKGVWQKRKGVPPADFKNIESEIMATVSGQAAIPSTTAEMSPQGAVGVPGAVGAVGVPGQQTPPLVLPIPADVNAATLQDCTNIVQVFAQIHGPESVAAHMQLWNMAEISQLPAELYGQFITYMVDEDAKITPA